MFKAIIRLVRYLGDYKPIPPQDKKVSLVASESSTLGITRYPDVGDNFVGIPSITIYLVPTGIRSIVEDVVVDFAMRRRGVAKALLKSAIEYAREMGASSEFQSLLYMEPVCQPLRGEFPNRVSYERFVALQPAVFGLLSAWLSNGYGHCQGISFIDSAAWSVGDIHRIHPHKVLAGYADHGKGAMGWFYRFKLHLAVNECRE